MRSSDCAPLASEAHRAACEARYVAGLESDEARARFMGGVVKRRGVDAAQKLRIAAWTIISGVQHEKR